MPPATLPCACVVLTLLVALGGSAQNILDRSHSAGGHSAQAESAQAQSAPPGEQVRVVVGRIWTASDQRPWAEAIAIRSDKIVAVGTREEVERVVAGNQIDVIKAGDGLVIPGTIDSHIHLIEGGLRLSSVQLRDVSSREQFVRRVGEFARQQKPGAWITGGDWDHTLWGGELPDRDWIDEVTPENPVWINRLDGHMALANSAALRAAGIEDNVEDVDGGEIVRDENRRLTGILKDNAMRLVDRVEPPPSLQQRLDAVAAAMKYLGERGVTSVHHMGTWSDVEVFRLARRQSLLTVRIYACTPLSQWERLAEEIKQHGAGDEWLKIGALKGFVDGSLGSRTAAFLAPFVDTPNNRGLLVNTTEDLEAWTSAADRAGLQVAVHAIGDRAIRLQLDVFERVAQANGPRDRRFRIEHAQHIAPGDIARFAELDVIPSMQPYHAIDDGRWAERLIGPVRSETSYAFRSLVDSGARPAFGSDWYVAPATPLEGIYAAVTRRTLDGKHPEGWVPRQKISVEEALRPYTIDAARASFSERSVGSLEAGKLADLVILERDIFRIPPEEIDQVDIALTMVGGNVVYQKKVRRPDNK